MKHFNHLICFSQKLCKHLGIGIIHGYGKYISQNNNLKKNDKFSAST